MKKLALFILCLLASLPVAAQSPDADTTAPAADSVAAVEQIPVVVGGDTLFVVQSRLGPYSASERAAAIQTRLRQLAQDPLARFESVDLIEGERSTDLMIGGVILTTVTDEDAQAGGVTREALARQRAAAIEASLREQSLAVRIRVILLGVLFTLLAAGATYFVFRLVNRVFPRIFELLEEGHNGWVPAIRVQKVEFVTAANVAAFLLAAARILRIVLIAFLLYISIPIILSFFPWTQRYSDQLFGYILTPFAVVWSGFLGYVPDMFMIAAIAIVTWYLLKLIRPLFAGLARETITFRGFYPEWAIPTYQIVRVLVVLFAVVAVWPYLPGSGSAAFQGVGVFFGLLVSLGSAAAISNVIGGVVITYMRPFKVNDRVKIADTVGDVVEKTLLVTRVRTPKNVDITIPNAMVLASHIVNYSSSAQAPGLILHTTVTIGYDVPWRKVHELLLKAAADTEQILAEPRPFVLQTSLDDFYVSYELNAYTASPRVMAATYSALHANIQDEFRQANVEIMSPHYQANRDGSATTIPSE